MDFFTQIAIRIIEEQTVIIGPIAWSEAQQVEGLEVDIAEKKVAFRTQDKQQAIEKLVRRYEKLFGRASLEVSRDAVKDLLRDTPQDQIPTPLR